METSLRLTVNDVDTAKHEQTPAHGKLFPYRELIGSLMYLATCTSLDLAYVVGQLIRYVQKPLNIDAAKRVLRYIIGTKSLGIVYEYTSGVQQCRLG